VPLLDYSAFDATPLARVPFDHAVVPHFIAQEHLRAIATDFPKVPGPGSHPPSVLRIEGAFKALMEELDSPALRMRIAEKFGVDLQGRPSIYTVRGFLRAKDGVVHSDSKTKIITLLLYLNETWELDGGRLRLLRSQDSLDDPAVEITPQGGTLLVFRRSDRSWHGHKPYAGPRRAIQMNWVTSQRVAQREQRRHHVATRLKQIKQWLLPHLG
jgi:hypothetical protein